MPSLDAEASLPADVRMPTAAFRIPARRMLLAGTDPFPTRETPGAMARAHAPRREAFLPLPLRAGELPVELTRLHPEASTPAARARVRPPTVRLRPAAVHPAVLTLAVAAACPGVV